MTTFTEALSALLAEAVLSNRLSKRFNLLTGQRWDQGATGVRS